MILSSLSGSNNTAIVFFRNEFGPWSPAERAGRSRRRRWSPCGFAYLWDEPLNYIDVISRIQIENMLVEYRPTLVFVEHDDAFVANVATKRLFLENRNDTD